MPFLFWLPAILFAGMYMSVSGRDSSPTLIDLEATTRSSHLRT
jgi:hypothetical protein